eukprot:GHUV01001317.1.p1 GENE.GHUV01001317.1~~GHUV01001317.1.p1  ORF type:complete len:305 (+),score=54.48 GHUV01001317.1:1385-2299(+)
MSERKGYNVVVDNATRIGGFAAAVLCVVLTLLFLPVWAPLFVMYRVAKATKPLVKGLAIRLVQTDRYGVPGHNGDTKNNPLGFSAVRFGWKPIKPELFASLKYLLAKNVRERWFNTLNVIILVSGLLTTSSYQAIYADLAAADDPSDKALTDWFRVANVVSFLASIATIICSAMIMLAMNRYVAIEEKELNEPEPHSSVIRLKTWSRVLIYFGYRVAIGSFFCSLGAALVAVGLGGAAFFTSSNAFASTVVVWAVLLVSVLMVFAGMAVFMVEQEDAEDQTTDSSSASEGQTTPVAPAQNVEEA